MEDFGMLDDEAKKNIELISEYANRIWGKDCKIGQIEIVNAPHSEFKLPISIYNKIKATITYDRSIIGIFIETKNGDIWIDDLTTQTVFDGFESSKPDNLLHNFQVLDEVAKNMIVR